MHEESVITTPEQENGQICNLFVETRCAPLCISLYGSGALVCATPLSFFVIPCLSFVRFDNAIVHGKIPYPCKTSC